MSGYHFIKVPTPFIKLFKEGLKIIQDLYTHHTTSLYDG